KSTHMRGKPASSRSQSRLHNLKRDLHFTKPHSSTHRRRRPMDIRGRHLGSKQPHKTHA
ncbi:hypothetical protein PIB30_099241, partial [Stylosanthes scabra]|nr:hypothetical protein [Stylosanthes scabra]